MNLRRWLLVGGASILGAVALLAPAGSSAFSNSAKYEGTINGDAEGGTVQWTQTDGVCTINAGQTIGITSVDAARKAHNALTISYTATTTGTVSPVLAGTFTDYGTASIAGIVVPCDATGIIVSYAAGPAGCAVNPQGLQNCDTDSVDAPFNVSYA
jgi:hypothetical protein